MAGHRRHPEEDLQRQVAQLLDHLGWLWWHTPNGGKRGRVEAGRLRGLGVKAGVPDILIAERWEVCSPLDVERCPWCGCSPVERPFGVAIELKSPRGVVRASQHHWLFELDDRGWLTAVCRTFEDVEEVLRHVRPENGRRYR